MKYTKLFLKSLALTVLGGIISTPFVILYFIGLIALAFNVIIGVILLIIIAIGAMIANGWAIEKVNKIIK